MVYADNGDPLLVYGHDGDTVMLWPTKYVADHPIAFGRFTRLHVRELRGKRVFIHHELSERVKRWAEWLGVNLETGVI